MKNILFFMFIIVSSFYVYARGENDGSGVVKRSKPVTDSTTTGTPPPPSPVFPPSPSPPSSAHAIVLPSPSPVFNVKRSKPVTDSTTTGTIRDGTINIHYDISPAIVEKNAEIQALRKQVVNLARKGHALAADLKACKGRKYASEWSGGGEGTEGSPNQNNSGNWSGIGDFIGGLFGGSDDSDPGGPGPGGGPGSGGPGSGGPGTGGGVSDEGGRR
ncbi:MAG: hypothetical protein OXM55_02600 [Bdellovibrionales bacterium]|nr:hypothetical protein [Bdellovibrionales bacterium]